MHHSHYINIIVQFLFSFIWCRLQLSAHEVFPHYKLDKISLSIEYRIQNILYCYIKRMLMLFNCIICSYTFRIYPSREKFCYLLSPRPEKLYLISLFYECMQSIEFVFTKRLACTAVVCTNFIHNQYFTFSTCCVSNRFPFLTDLIFFCSGISFLLQSNLNLGRQMIKIAYCRSLRISYANLKKEIHTKIA